LIKSHPFFADIDWDKVRDKQYKPPIRPKVKSASDTKYFDKILLKEKVMETRVSRNDHRNRNHKSIDTWNLMHFENFTYVKEEDDNLA
jgi:hypothetical protein